MSDAEFWRRCDAFWTNAGIYRRVGGEKPTPNDVDERLRDPLQREDAYERSLLLGSLLLGEELDEAAIVRAVRAANGPPTPIADGPTNTERSEFTPRLLLATIVAAVVVVFLLSIASSTAEVRLSKDRGYTYRGWSCGRELPKDWESPPAVAPGVAAPKSRPLATSRGEETGLWLDPAEPQFRCSPMQPLLLKPTRSEVQTTIEPLVHPSSGNSTCLVVVHPGEGSISIGKEVLKSGLYELQFAASLDGGSWGAPTIAPVPAQ
ncbi:MAG: hypothetical protein H6737_23795 [Alphaproteobacteria bacterium]|nr:hypothetical protein [Alphaproteobacteria bacterium]